MTGTIFDIKKYSIHDGPGIRTTVFFKGCPLRCVWCHNPEGQKTSAEIMFFSDRCTLCRTCVSVCPNHAIILKDAGHEGTGIHTNQVIIPKDADFETAGVNRGRSVVLDEGNDGECGTPRMDRAYLNQHVVLESGSPDMHRAYGVHTLRERCIACGACVKACPQGAREVAGRVVTSDELIDEIMKDVVFYDSSGGGVTFSGGEPLLQLDFLLALLKECREREINTAVDTCGFAKWETMSAIVPYADLILYDLKCMDPGMHFELTGCGNEVILRNLKCLSKTHANVIVRFPLIPGINDNEENIVSMGKFVSSLKWEGESPRVDVLPYHNTGIGKYERLERVYSISHIAQPADEMMNSVRTKLRGFGLEA